MTSLKKAKQKIRNRVIKTSPYNWNEVSEIINLSLQKGKEIKEEEINKLKMALVQQTLETKEAYKKGIQLGREEVIKEILKFKKDTEPMNDKALQELINRIQKLG